MLMASAAEHGVYAWFMVGLPRVVMLSHRYVIRTADIAAWIGVGG